MQASFQMHHDDAASGDHTFKLAQLISAQGCTGKAFTALYTVMMSKLGHVICNRPTFTKANNKVKSVQSPSERWRYNA